jgi:hypothetical protein
MDDEIMPMPSSIVERVADGHWVVVEDSEQVERYRKLWGNFGGSERVVCWADLPAKAGEVEDLIVYFHALFASEFRKAQRLEHDLRFLEGLSSLSIPVSFVPELDPGALPASLRRIAVEGDGRASFAKGYRFPDILVLDAWWPLSCPNREVKFAAEAFPSLQEVSCRIDAKQAILNVLASYPRMACVYVGPVKDEGVLAKLAPIAIDCLKLERGSVTSLEGIQNIRGMRFLSVKNMDRLVDISALALCKDLEVLQIHWCANLRDHESLLKIPRLKSIFLFRCNALDPEACESALVSRPALQRRFWGCTGSRHGLKPK